MCVSIKALLRNIGDSFNAGYLVLVLQQRILFTAGLLLDKDA